MKNVDKKTIGQLFNENHDNNVKYIVVGIDETEYWIDPIKEQIINALGVYLFINEPTHLCSIDLNYPAIHLYDSFIRKEEFEESEYLNESELENHGISDETDYYGESFVPDEYHLVTHDNLNYDDEITEEEIAECYLCNQVI